MNAKTDRGAVKPLASQDASVSPAARRALIRSFGLWGLFIYFSMHTQKQLTTLHWARVNIRTDLPPTEVEGLVNFIWSPLISTVRFWVVPFQFG
jgi:hypothetical protein